MSQHHLIKTEIMWLKCVGVFRALSFSLYLSFCVFLFYQGGKDTHTHIPMAQFSCITSVLLFLSNCTSVSQIYIYMSFFLFFFCCVVLLCGIFLLRENITLQLIHRHLRIWLLTISYRVHSWNHKVIVIDYKWIIWTCICTHLLSFRVCL